MDSKRRKISSSKKPVVIDKSQPQNTVTSVEKDSLQTKCDSSDNSANKQNQFSYRLVPLNQQNPSNTSQSTCSNNQFLVMMPNNRDLLNQNIFIKTRTDDNFSKSLIDQKRRLMHKEIERRRRDKINDWILVLSKQVPDCASDQSKQGQSKGGILAKTANYIQELRSENERLNVLLEEKSKLSEELDRVREQLIETEAENKRLKSLLHVD